MTVPRYDSVRAKLADGWRNRALSLKAITFGLVGVVNTAIDFSIFLIAQWALQRSATALSMIDALADTCHCGNQDAIVLIVANIMSWSVAVTCSYILNSSITFAAESGRQLRWRAYGTFVASGVIGWIANTAALVCAAQIFLLPIWLAKGVAIFASFVVNFSLSHFVVFRALPPSPTDARDDV